MPRIIEFEGRRIEVPDDATDDEVRGIIDGGAAQPAQQPMAWAGAESTNRMVAEPPPPPDPMRALQLGSQDVGRGLANTIGAPFDITNLLLNLPISVADFASEKLGGPSIDFRLPTNAGGTIADAYTGAATALGAPEPIAWEDRTPEERVRGNIIDFGTQGLAGGAGLARTAISHFAKEAPKAVPKLADTLLRPYADNAVRTVAGDTAAGAGSGAGVSFAEEKFPDSPLAAALGALVGGMGGSVVPTTVSSPKAAFDTLTSVLPDQNIPVNREFAPVSRRTADYTARLVQDQATDPVGAAEKIRARTDAARAEGEPVPTAGIASDDIGLVALEKGARLKDQVRFQERDQAVADFASDRVSDLRDQTANQQAATDFAQARPGQLAADRDAAALPLLRQAEASGAVVDAAPVAAKIDTMLSSVKRPAVRSALTQAREMLNKVGTDELDDSVAGLYETRKAINDIIEGRTDTPTGRYAQKELIEVRKALDAELGEVSPDFSKYLDEFREGSKPLDIFKESSMVAKLLDEDPRAVADRIFHSKYGTEKQLDEINTVIGKDPEAVRGWKSAVSDVLSDMVRNTNTAIGGPEGQLSIAKLQRVFKQHENALAKIYSPSEMNALRRAHKALEPMGNLSRRSTTGSPTAEYKQLNNALEAGILAVTGNAITTGMIMKRIKTGLSLMPGVKNLTLEGKMQNLVERMWFDPELAAHLLTKDVKEVRGPRWNATLNRLLGVAEYARESEEDE